MKNPVTVQEKQQMLNVHTVFLQLKVNPLKMKAGEKCCNYWKM